MIRPGAVSGGQLGWVAFYPRQAEIQASPPNFKPGALAVLPECDRLAAKQQGESPMRETMTPNAILETCLYAADLEAAEAFYTGLLGLSLVLKEAGRHVFLRCGPGMLLIFNPESTARPDPASPIPGHGAIGPGHVCFAAGAGEIPDWIDHLTAQGVDIEADHRWPTGARSIYFRDPAGNSLEIGEPKMWGYS